MASSLNSSCYLYIDLVFSIKWWIVSFSRWRLQITRWVSWLFISAVLQAARSEMKCNTACSFLLVHITLIHFRDTESIERQNLEWDGPCCEDDGSGLSPLTLLKTLNMDSCDSVNECYIFLLPLRGLWDVLRCVCAALRLCELCRPITTGYVTLACCDWIEHLTQQKPEYVNKCCF